MDTVTLRHLTAVQCRRSFSVSCCFSLFYISEGNVLFMELRHRIWIYSSEFWGQGPVNTSDSAVCVSMLTFTTSMSVDQARRKRGGLWSHLCSGQTVLLHGDVGHWGPNIWAILSTKLWTVTIKLFYPHSSQPAQLEEISFSPTTQRIQVFLPAGSRVILASCSTEQSPSPTTCPDF